MPDDLLKSYRFRQEREGKWRELEALIARAERHGLKSLDAEELARAPALYRACMSSLSVARSISLDANLLAYLESLSLRAYFVVYGVRANLGQVLARFFRRDFPVAVRRTGWSNALAAGLLLAGVATGWAVTAKEPAWFEAFVSTAMAQGRTPDATRQELAETIFDKPKAADQMTAFATFLFTHNARIGMLCFALGAAFGVPVVLLLFYNGLAIGAICAVFDGKDLTVEFLAWLAIHGTTELTAIVLCGGAGLHLGGAMINPTRRTRLAALRAKGRTATILVVGAVVMLFVAALLEGLGRQLITDTTTRMAVGCTMLVLWLAYFTLGGRSVPMGPRHGQ
ncbi:MAG: stage II sporulation protein M [Gammaproteobacteria bacterium]|nr:stage II sporulation protein M [Gammaproteobacteria bacterium]MYF31096.1 stage II sporulation protein M [Gammaproteobacteria bacterium]MYK45373.1 stage II sporulation protein M [Gammaproteobacteria bacterium]